MANLPDPPDGKFSWRPIDLNELLNQPYRIDLERWGPWRLDPDVLVLYPVRPYRYEVDLERCLTSAQVLDWIIQIGEKDWADDELLAGLIRALDDVLHPQANLCSCGTNKQISKKRVAELVKRADEIIGRSS